MNTTSDGTGAGAHHNRPEAGHQLFSWLRSTGLYRPDGSWVGGVFAAAAQKLGWDTALVRGLGIVAFILFASPALLFYGLGWLFLPDARGRIHAQEGIRGSYPSGLWGAGLLTVLGAVNVFTPNLVGPFAILLNLVIIGVVGWVIWLLISNHRGDANRSADPKAQSSRPEGSPGGDADHPGQGGDARRADGKPAWYPKQGPPSAEQAASVEPEPAPGPAVRAAAPSEPVEDPAEQEQRRRGRMVTLGLLLLAVPLIAGGAWLATQIGLATTSAVLLGLAAVVILLALMHLVSAFRGAPGRPGLLWTFTGLMMLVFFLAPTTNGAPHLLGDYTTSSSEVNTAFANTTVDLRDLRFTEEDAVELSSAQGTAGLVPEAVFHTSVDVNNAFANTTVVVPDDVYLELDPNNFLANITVHTQHEEQDQSGISGSRFAVGPEEAIAAVEITANNAFGNVTVYDETTYNQQELGNGDDADSDDEDDTEEGR